MILDQRDLLAIVNAPKAFAMHCQYHHFSPSRISEFLCLKQCLTNLNCYERKQYNFEVDQLFASLCSTLQKRTIKLFLRSVRSAGSDDICHHLSNDVVAALLDKYTVVVVVVVVDVVVDDVFTNTVGFTTINSTAVVTVIIRVTNVIIAIILTDFDIIQDGAKARIQFSGEK